MKSVTVSTVSPSIRHEAMGPDAMIFVFLMLSFKPTFSLLVFFDYQWKYLGLHISVWIHLWVCLCSIGWICTQFSSVQSLSCVQLSVTLWITACQSSLSITNSWSSPKLMSIKLVMPSSHLILCCPLLLPPSVFPSIRVFSSELVLRIRWPNYWSFSFSIIPSKEIPGLISFRMDWLDLLAVQGTLKSLLQHHSSKASFLQCSAFFIVQLSHAYMTTGKP